MGASPEANALPNRARPQAAPHRQAMIEERMTQSPGILQNTGAFPQDSQHYTHQKYAVWYQRVQEQEQLCVDASALWKLPSAYARF